MYGSCIPSTLSANVKTLCRFIAKTIDSYTTKGLLEILTCVNVNKNHMFYNEVNERKERAKITKT